MNRPILSGVSKVIVFVSIAGTVAILAFYLGSSLRASPQGVEVNPFYLERTLSVPNTSGQLELWRKEVISRAADGRVVRIRTVGPPAGQHAVREITSPDGTYVTLYDSVRLKSTFPPKMDHNMSGTSSRTTSALAPRDCATESSAKPSEGRTFQFKGYGVVEGREVAKIESTSGERRSTRWRAASLGCEDLYYKSEIIQPDGSMRTALEKTVSRLVVGDPDPKLFDPGSDYGEVPPSTAHARMLENMSVAFPPEELANMRSQDRTEDRGYRAARQAATTPQK
jgi:hypothetical protein